MSKEEDKIDALEKSLKEVVEAFAAMKKAGINDEMLIAYIYYKTKLSIRDIKAVLESYAEFHTRLINKTALEALEEK